MSRNAPIVQPPSQVSKIWIYRTHISRISFGIAPLFGPWMALPAFLLGVGAYEARQRYAKKLSTAYDKGKFKITNYNQISTVFEGENSQQGFLPYWKSYFKLSNYLHYRSFAVGIAREQEQQERIIECGYNPY